MGLAPRIVMVLVVDVRETMMSESCFCIDHLRKRQTEADTEVQRLRKQFNIQGLAYRDGTTGAECLIAKIEASWKPSFEGLKAKPSLYVK